MQKPAAKPRPQDKPGPPSGDPALQAREAKWQAALQQRMAEIEQKYQAQAGAAAADDSLLEALEDEKRRALEQSKHAVEQARRAAIDEVNQAAEREKQVALEIICRHSEAAGGVRWIKFCVVN